MSFDENKVMRKSKTINIGCGIDLSAIKRVEEPQQNEEEENQKVEKQDDFIEEMLKMQQQVPIKPVFDPSMLTIEESSKRRELIIKINRYKLQFPHLLGEWASTDLLIKSIPELENIHNDIRLTIQNNGVNKMGLIAYSSCLEIVESCGPTLNMELQGLSTICMKNEEIVSAVNELMIESCSTKVMPAHTRLVILTAGVIMSLNNHNKKNIIINNFSNKELTDEFVDKYKDL
jgi:hypothetical protein